MTDQPFTIAVYDKTMRRVGWVGDPVNLTVVVRHNQQSTAALTVRADHVRLPDLVTPGARVAITYLGTVILTGRIRLRSGRGPRTSGTVTLQVSDDWRLLTRVHGRPNPAGTLTQQGVDGAYDTRTGPAEDVVHGFVQANAITRLSLPVTLGTNLHRGTPITVAMRFHPLADRLFPAVDTAGLGVTVRQAGPPQQGTGLRVDCYTPTTYPRDLTEESGVVQEWSWDQADPDITRAVGGAAGEGELRAFRQVIDTAREATWGDLVEGFRDARDVQTTDVGWETVLDTRIRELLDESAPKAGLSMQLAETSTFRYDPTGLSGVRAGDRVRVEVGPGVVVDDVIRSATFTWSPDDGVTVLPSVGERSDDPDRVLVRAVAALARSFRDTARR